MKLSLQGTGMQERYLTAWLCAIAAAFGGFNFGYESGCINGTVVALQNAFHETGIGSGFNVASVLLGCAVGAWFAGSLADRFGRRTVLRFSILVFLVSIYGSGAATSAMMFVCSRVMGGVAVGAVSIIVPAYISEIAPAKIRGRMSCMQQMAIVLGLFLSFVVNYCLAKLTGSAEAILWLNEPAWRWMFWAQFVPAIAFALVLMLIPESPRWLVMVNRDADAAKALAIVQPHADSDVLIRAIRSTLTHAGTPRFRDLITASGKLHPLFWVGIMIASFQQFVGINVVFYYGEVLWQAAGFTTKNALALNVLGGSINVLSTIAAVVLVDRLGRKPLLLIGSAGMTLFLAIMAIVFMLAPVRDDGNLRLTMSMATLALVSVYLYIICFAVTWGPVCWVLLGEMFPNRIRGAALACAGLAQWGANFLVSISFPTMMQAIGLGGAYAVYATAALVSFFLVRKFIAETKGIALEDMFDRR